MNEEDSDFEPELNNRERQKRRYAKKTPFTLPWERITWFKSWHVFDHPLHVLHFSNTYQIEPPKADDFYLLFPSLWNYMNRRLQDTLKIWRIFLSRLEIRMLGKLEKILKGSLLSIPSPSVKIQIMGGKVCLRCKGKTLPAVVNKLFKTKNFQSFYPSEPFRISHFTMRHPVRK